MVTTVNPADPRNRAAPGQGFDGVVRITVGTIAGTGVLLYDGAAVLTAAHLFSQGSAGASVAFETTAGSTARKVSSVQTNPGYDPSQSNNDLALVWLASPAPVQAERYTLYRPQDELGQTLTLVGYGLSGTGAAGDTAAALTPSAPVRLKANNQFDADAALLKRTLGSGLSWSPALGTQLLADFDNGSPTQDTLGRLLSLGGLGLGANEGLIAPGDSGGPAFLGGQVAGIASYTSSLSTAALHPDVDAQVNSSFGEVAAWQRVSSYQQWIDQTLRAHNTDAPTQPSAVQKAVPEGSSGTSLTYFLVRFSGMRTDPNQWLSVDFTTRDGTATAGQDYVATHGTLVIYPNETQAVFAVEVIGDTTPEANETFYLDLSHPVGGSFPYGMPTLTAVRTIQNDDPGQLL